MAARSNPGGFVVATVTNPGSFMATITHPTGNGYCHGSRLQVAGSKSTKDGFFSEKKSSLPGGQSHYSLQRTVGGSFGTRG